MGESDQSQQRQDSARGVRSRRTSRARTAATPPSPTRSITPGKEHTKLAELILKSIQRRARDQGIELDVGEFPSYAPSGDAGGEPDPERPVRILSHAIARVADRVGFTRKISRHLEGREARSGLISDLLAELVALYERNEEQFEVLTRLHLLKMKQRAQASAAQRAASESHTNGGTRRGLRRHRREAPVVEDPRDPRYSTQTEESPQ